VTVREAYHVRGNFVSGHSRVSGQQLFVESWAMSYMYLLWLLPFASNYTSLDPQFINSYSSTIGDESVPIQLAQCRFPGLVIFNAAVLIYFFK